MVLEYGSIDGESGSMRGAAAAALRPAPA